jgi:hypothetical protein
MGAVSTAGRGRRPIISMPPDGGVDRMAVRLHQPNGVANTKDRATGFGNWPRNQDATATSDLECVLNNEKQCEFHPGRPRPGCR